VTENGDDAGDITKGCAGGCVTPDDDGRHPSLPGEASDGLAAFAGGGARDGAGIDDGKVGIVRVIGGAKAEGFEGFADLLGLVLVDFTAPRG